MLLMVIANLMYIREKERKMKKRKKNVAGRGFMFVHNIKLFYFFFRKNDEVKLFSFVHIKNNIAIYNVHFCGIHITKRKKTHTLNERT